MSMYNLHCSVKPCQNESLQHKFNQRFRDAHLKALANIKPTLDTTAPKTFQIIHLNSKKDRNEKENLYRITEENNRLLKRIHEIRKHDIILDKEKQHIKKSLNEQQRLKEVKRVTQENKEIVKRLKNLKNPYNQANWEHDWMNAIAYMNNISKYTVINTFIQSTMANSNEQQSNEYRELIESIVDSVIQLSLNYIQNLNTNPSNVDGMNHSNYDENNQQHCTEINQGKLNESPMVIRNLISSIIQSSLYHVYEKDLLHKLGMKFGDSGISYEIEPADYNYYDLEKLCPNESSDDIIDEVILSDNTLPALNIQWPTIEEFTPILGLEKIEQYIKNTMILVYYQVETFRSIHIPGKSKFSERWLTDVIDSKIRLMSYVNF
ncbi:unnamed protein product [Schistosoma turkestanicum]|nr:unnamed protein product [Schistosoma turkestanicum]